VEGAFPERTHLAFLCARANGYAACDHGARRWALLDDDRGLASYVRTAQRVEWIAIWSKRYLLAQALAAILLGVNLLQRLGQNRRMSFVADTLSGAWMELYHFFAVLVFVVSTFSVLGPLLIGDQMEVFSQLQYIIEGAPALT
jgi:hypothetical protein